MQSVALVEWVEDQEGCSAPELASSSSETEDKLPTAGRNTAIVWDLAVIWRPYSAGIPERTLTLCFGLFALYLQAVPTIGFQPHEWTDWIEKNKRYKVSGECWQTQLPFNTLLEHSWLMHSNISILAFLLSSFFKQETAARRSWN